MADRWLQVNQNEVRNGPRTDPKREREREGLRKKMGDKLRAFLYSGFGLWRLYSENSSY